MSKEFEVTLPIFGVAYLTVEAEDEKSAIEAAMEAVTMNDIEEWSAYHRITSGNVLHVSPNEATAEEV